MTEQVPELRSGTQLAPSNRALIFQRMDRWRRDLDSRFAKAQLLVHCGAPDPNFGTLADELRTFRYCLEVLASRGDGGGA